jgi:protein SDA1
VLKIVLTNFVNKGNSAEVIAVRLNAIREFCARFPLLMNEELLQDLLEYRTSKQKSVMMAARPILQLHRVVFGREFLPLKERVRKLPIV